MTTYNLYYTTLQGDRRCIREIRHSVVLENVSACLAFGDEITGIINSEDDK